MDFLSAIGNYISAKFTYKTTMMNQQINNNQQQAINIACCATQLRLQDALFQAMHKVNISSQLCRLENPGELLPYGYQFTDDTTVYFFAWTKNNSDAIATSSLHRLAEKMNIAILAKHNKFCMYLQQFDYYTQSQLIQMNGILYNGFMVLGCKDVGDSVILAVTFI